MPRHTPPHSQSSLSIPSSPSSPTCQPARIPLKLVALLAILALLSSPLPVASAASPNLLPTPQPRHRFLVRNALNRRHDLADPNNRQLHRRQQTGGGGLGGIFGPPEAATTSAPAPAPPPAATTTNNPPASDPTTRDGGNDNNPPASTTTTNGGILDPILSGITGASSSAAPVSTTDVRSTSRVSSSRVSSIAVVTSTSTSGAISGSNTLPPLASASADSDKKNDDGGGGIGKGTLIAVIVIASCVGGVAAIWTVIRKWKFSPSKRFEEKLQPIDFGDSHDPMVSQANDSSTALNRKPSNRSDGADSFHSWNQNTISRSERGGGGGEQWPANPYAMPSHAPAIPYGMPPQGGQGFGQEYYPPPAAPYAHSNLSRNDSWRSAPGGGGQMPPPPQQMGGYGGYGGRY